MSNSPLVNYTKISPNTNPRVNSTYNPTGKITKISIHHMAGKLSVETCGNVFQTRKASSNYGIGTDGRVGMYATEDLRTWCSSNKANDYVAVTIECANSTLKPTWEVSDVVLAKLIDLCVDICQRNGIESLNYTGDPTGNLTTHDMFVATTCPGPYLKSKMNYIADEVNKRLNPEEPKTDDTTTEGLVAGAKLILEDVNLYSASDSSRRAKTITGTYYLWSTDVINNRVKITNAPDRVGVEGQVTGWINESDAKAGAQVNQPAPAPTPAPTPAPKPAFNAEKVADDIIAGKYGNGSATRHANMTAAGFTDEQIKAAQDVVNARYSKSSVTGTLDKGDRVKFRTVKSNEKLVWATGQTVPSWVRQTKLYVRSKPSGGKCSVSTVKTGPITGVAYTKDLVKV